MNDLRNKIRGFVMRERVYISLFLFIILVYASFALIGHLLESSGLGNVFQEESYKEERLIDEDEIREIFSSNPVISAVFYLLFLVFIFFVLGGVVLDIVYISFGRRKAAFLSRTQFVGRAAWDFWDICKVVIIFLFVHCIMSLADLLFFHKIPYLELRRGIKLALSTTLVDIIGIGALLYFVLDERKEKLHSLGLTTKRLFLNIRYGVLAYVGLIPVLAGVMFLSAYIFDLFNIPVKPQPVLIMLREEKHIPTLLYMGFFTGLLGPIMEEIFFRGFAYSVFKKKLGVSGGIILSAVFFAYIHTNLASFFPILCLGILLAYVYERTGSLVSSITVHIIHNSSSLIILFLIKAAVG